jgi:hypothetical protein
MLKLRHWRLRRIVVGAAVMGLALVASGQTAPAKPTMTLNFQDTELDTILAETSSRLGFVVIRQRQFPERVTVVSGKPVDAMEAGALLNEKLWPMGYRIIANMSNEATARLVLVMVARPTAKNPAEMRIWRRTVPVLPPRKTAAAFPGVQVSSTMKLEFVNKPLSDILETMGKQWGLETADAQESKRPVTVVTPRPVTAWQAVNIVDDVLFAHDELLEVAATAGGKTGLKVVQKAAPAAAKNEEIPLQFDNAPLETVLNEISRLSGYQLRNTVPEGIKVTLNETLQKEAIGVDIGRVVTHLNDMLEKEGVVILETSRGREGGELEPVLRILTQEEAKRTLLGPIVESRPQLTADKEWVHVDKESTMTFMYQMTPIDTLLTDVAKRFGFVLVSEVKLDIPVTLSNTRALDAVASVKLANDILYPLGCVAVVILLPEADATELRIVALRDLKEYVKAGRFKTAEK